MRKKNQLTILPFLNKKLKINILFIFFSLILIKLMLTSGQSIFAIGGAGHDDRLFINLAQHLIRGEWLGEYNNLTLAKGMFFPLFIALSFKIGIPLIISQQLLYILGTVIFTISIKPFFKNSFALIIPFTVLLFNPISYANIVFTRVVRDGIYLSLTLIVVSLSVGYLLRIKNNYSNQVLWLSLLGAFFLFFWLTREEGVWLLPLVAIIIMTPILIDGYDTFTRKLNKQVLINRVLLSLIPLLITIVGIHIVSSINQRYYDLYTRVEFQSNSFVDAYGSLLRVHHENWIPDVPVPKDVRQKVYAVSPAFKELEPFLEGDIGKSWMSEDVNDIKGGWFVWAFRDSVSAAGYYRDAKTSSRYYERIANEVNDSCSQGKLTCLKNKKSSMNPPFKKAYIGPFINTVKSSIHFIYSYSGISAYPSESIGDYESYNLFSDVTKSPVSPLVSESNPFTNQAARSSRLNNILDGIIYIYKTFTYPITIVLSIICTLVIVLDSLRNKSSRRLCLILLLLLSIIATRLLLISYIHVSSFSAVNILYLSPVHPLMLAYLTLSITYVLFEKFFPNVPSKLRFR